MPRSQYSENSQQTTDSNNNRTNFSVDIGSQKISSTRNTKANKTYPVTNRFFFIAHDLLNLTIIIPDYFPQHDFLVIYSRPKGKYIEVQPGLSGNHGRPNRTSTANRHFACPPLRHEARREMDLHPPTRQPCCRRGPAISANAAHRRTPLAPPLPARSPAAWPAISPHCPRTRGRRPRRQKDCARWCARRLFPARWSCPDARR